MNPKTGAAPRAVAVLFISIALLKSCGAEAGALCRAEEHSNGTTYILDESIAECEGYYWYVNGTVVAHEENLNRSLVYKRQFQRITLTGCHKDVTHKNVCNGVLTNCSYTCRQSPWSPFDTCRQSPWSPFGLSVIAICGAILVLVIMFIFLAWKLKYGSSVGGEPTRIPYTKMLMKMDCKREMF